MGLVQLIYASARVGTFGVDDARSILDAAKRRNEPADITGLLIYGEGFFLQVLEGDTVAATETFIRIGTDPRHEHISLLSVEAIAERSFPTWAMRYIDISRYRAEVLRFSATASFRPHDMNGRQALGFAMAIAEHESMRQAA